MKSTPSTVSDPGRFTKTIETLAAINARDPHEINTGDGPIPAEWFYSRERFKWIMKLNPEASEALYLAGWAQHLARWEVPRDQFPQGKAGYFQWRNHLKKYHADYATKVLTECGYTDDICQRVRDILQKKNLHNDSEVQTMEDVLCLVFLEFQFDEFAEKHEESKLIDILQKTWKKMSEDGRQVAQTLPLSDKAQKLIHKALQ